MGAAFFVVRRHPNVHLELSGIPPSGLLEYFPRLEEIAAGGIWFADRPSPGMTVDARQRRAVARPGDHSKRPRAPTAAGEAPAQLARALSLRRLDESCTTTPHACSGRSIGGRRMTDRELR